MLELSLIDRDLYLAVRRRQEDLWDALLGRLVENLAGVAESDWTGTPRFTMEELYEDLEFGQA